MHVDDKLGENRYVVDKEPHIAIDAGRCSPRCTTHACIAVCPADLFEIDSRGGVTVSWEGCLECGTCMICCPERAISWNYPRGGWGVQYRAS